ncbi:uncharacterized protein PAC_05547 [Phialocephala subalpina]|uniref:Protein TED1 n=1 Tax=Phialocephala subalpina TaxID=576137 RepID=A0A1L7WSA7_9HELO|nr:uncharacterized protein PAC_05547 [Phialocephala subalpina]
MFLLCVLRYALFLLVPLSLILSSYLYLYPVFHLCAFPSPSQDGLSSKFLSSRTTSYLDTLLQHTSFSNDEKIAPFRLLALGDPQLEGDSSIDNVEAAKLPHWHKFLDHGGGGGFGIGFLRGAMILGEEKEEWKTRIINVAGNHDIGYAGDIDQARMARFTRMFGKANYEMRFHLPEGVEAMILGEEKEEWKTRIINVAGNHDIGYAGDIDQARMARFTRMFGKANYEMRFHLPTNTTADDGEEEKEIPELRIIVLNDMNLDTPAGTKELQDETYNFLNGVITTSQDVTRAAHFTIVLTHIPLFKEEGVCVDGPFFDFFDGEFGNGVKEQNHLSRDASKGFLEGIFGMSGNTDVPGHGFGRHGVILNGHDHEGCDVYHYINQSSPPEREWAATKYPQAVATGVTEEMDIPGLRELTLRSMMGDFGGNAGLLSLWFDREEWDWRFEFVNCALGTQHIWWIVHILDLITLGVGVVYVVLAVLQSIPARPAGMVQVGDGKVARANGGVKGPSPKEKTNGHATPQYTMRIGVVEEKDTGKGSLRKKKSKATMNGSSSNGSAMSDR